MINLEKKAFQDALEHVDKAQLAAERAFDTYPSWAAFRLLFSNALKLKNLVQTLPLLQEFEKRAEVLGKYDNLVISMASRLFEVESERYLKEQYNYTSTFSPYSPPYLKGKQIDVYAEKGIRDRIITACECKFRFKGKPLSIEEVNNFAEKMAILRGYLRTQSERQGVRCKIFGWIISNAMDAESEVWRVAKENKIDLKHAILTKNWEKDAYWKIIDIIPLAKKIENDSKKIIANSKVKNDTLR
jgi:hypothetical protein